MELRLEGEVGGTPVSFSVKPGIWSIGRSAESSFPLPDPSVSRIHAELLCTPESTVLRDAGSRNGTFVNGRRLAADERVTLAPRDAVRLGAVSLKVRGDDESSLEESLLFSSLDSALATGEDVRPSARLSWEEIKSEQASGRAQSLLGILIEAGGLLVAPRPMHETFEVALGLAARIVPAQRVLLLLLDEPENRGSERGDTPGPTEAPHETPLPVVRAAHPPGAAANTRLLLSRTLLRMILEERTALLVDDALADPRLLAQESIMALELHSAMAAPLFDNERVIGLIYADTNDIRQRFDSEQLRAFSVLANLLAVKITNARLHEGEEERERMRHEMERAARIQQSLLPQTLPRFETWDLYAVQRPCYECAGDLYEVVRTSEGVFIAVGDVSGKGMGAALLMSHVMACLRLLLEESMPLDALVAKLHRQVWRASRPSDYLTLFLARQVSEDSFEYVNAGHNPPLVVRSDGRVEQLGPTGFPVGLIEEATFEIGRISFGPDDLLAVYTDGVTETHAPVPAANEDDDEYGTDRLGRVLASGWRESRTLDPLAQAILSDVDRFRGDAPPEDDITILLLAPLSAVVAR